MKFEGAQKLWEALPLNALPVATGLVPNGHGGHTLNHEAHIFCTRYTKQRCDNASGIE